MPIHQKRLFLTSSLLIFILILSSSLYPQSKTSIQPQNTNQVEQALQRSKVETDSLKHEIEILKTRVDDHGHFLDWLIPVVCMIIVLFLGVNYFINREINKEQTDKLKKQYEELNDKIQSQIDANERSFLFLHYRSYITSGSILANDKNKLFQSILLNMYAMGFYYQYITFNNNKPNDTELEEVIEFFNLIFSTIKGYPNINDNDIKYLKEQQSELEDTLKILIKSDYNEISRIGIDIQHILNQILKKKIKPKPINTK